MFAREQYNDRNTDEQLHFSEHSTKYVLNVPDQVSVRFRYTVTLHSKERKHEQREGTYTARHLASEHSHPHNRRGAVIRNDCRRNRKQEEAPPALTVFDTWAPG